MTLSHPLQRIAPGRIRYWSVPLAILVAIILALLPVILPLRDTHTLIELVEAGSPAAAAEILVHWSESEKIRTAYGVGLDFLLNPAYATFAALACVWGSRVFHDRRWSQLGIVLAWLAWGAIVTNVVENVALFRMLLGTFASPWPELARLAHFYAGAVLFGGALPYAAAACVARVHER